MICSLYPDFFFHFLVVLVLSMEGRPVDPDSFSSLVTEQLNEEVVSFIYAGLYKLLQLAIRTPPALLKQEVRLFMVQSVYESVYMSIYESNNCSAVT